MKSLFDVATATEIKNRVARLGPGNERQWGRMNLPQVLAHCSGVMELALGDRRPPRVFIGRILGWAMKRKELSRDTPMRRGTPTLPDLVIVDRRDFDGERKRLAAMIDRFVTGGPAACTTHTHPFFGRLTPQEWATFEYRHLDHHLRQFGG
jgi:hypothetical protein